MNIFNHKIIGFSFFLSLISLLILVSIGVVLAAPIGWTCDWSTYGDMSCDYGCGVADTLDCTCWDANLATDPELECATVGYCEFAAGAGCIYLDGPPPPIEWTCDPSYFGDGQCDCGCGYVDSDCSDSTAAVCTFDFCTPDAIVTDDNSQCDVGVSSSTPPPDTTAPPFTYPPADTAIYEYYTCDSSRIGNNWCDNDLNNAQCSYDGGDCCTEPCTGFACLFNFFRPNRCVDPAVTGIAEPPTSILYCSDFTTETNCENYNNCYWDNNLASCETGERPYVPQLGDDIPGWSGDGWCDLVNNYNLFGYDGGDCCESTCTDGDYICGTAGYDCQQII